MASSRLSFDNACELLLEWYYQMRVEFLTDDELEYELVSRAVLMDGNFNVARKRKLLRDRLKAERDGTVEKHVQSVVGDESTAIDVCSQKFVEIKTSLDLCQEDENKNQYFSRLLHLGMRVWVIVTGSRGSPNSYSHMQNLIVDLVEILEPNMGQLSKPRQEQQLVELGYENPEVGNEDENEQPVQMHSPRRSVLSQDDLDWIHSLQTRIIGLENELRQRKEGKDVGTQTHFDIAQRPSQHNHHAFHFNDVPSLQPSVPMHAQSSYHNFQNFVPQQHPFSIQRKTPNNNPRFDSEVFNASQNPLRNPFTDFPENEPFQENFNRNFIPTSHHLQNHLTGPNQFHNSNFPIQYPSRHTLPVSKWNITKYSGDDQGLKLNEFLELVQALSQAEHVSERELFESAIHLFGGSALKWYMTQRSTGRLLNWQHLVFELRKTYMHPDLDALIKMKIYQRRQQKYESFHEFYFEMEKLFRTMSVQIPDYEKVQILQQNMRVDYKRQMTFIPIVDLETLVAAGQKLDSLNFSAYNKVFGPEKSVQAVESGTNTKNRKKSSQQQTSGQVASAQYSQGRNNRTNISNFQNSAPRPNQTSSSNIQDISNSQPSQKPKPTIDRQVAGPSGCPPRPRLTLDELVNGHIPPPSNTCFNCGREGHHSVMCRQPRGVFCFKCGLQGFPTNYCPFCLKNGPTASENRRSQNPEA